LFFVPSFEAVPVFSQQKRVCPLRLWGSYFSAVVGNLFFVRFFPRVSLQNLPCGTANKFVRFPANLCTDAIHRFRHPLRGVSGQIFGQGQAVHFAPRFFQSPHQPLRLRVYLIRNRNRSFHTNSITAERKLSSSDVRLLSLRMKSVSHQLPYCDCAIT
jgi:hypothetical protein